MTDHGPLVGWKPRTVDARVASTRIRCLNPLRELQRRGVRIELFRPDRASAYDLVVYSKLYDADSCREAAALQRRGARIVLDLCDNHLYNPSGLPELEQAAVALRRMMAVADYLVVSTAALAEVIRAELPTPRPITIIGDAVEETLAGVPEPFLTRWGARWNLRRVRAWIERGRRDEGRTALVWFGIHGGPRAEHGMLDLERVRPLLERLGRDYPVSLTVVSNSSAKYRRAVAPWAIPTVYLAWRATTFLDVLRAHQIAVIPVVPNPFTACKSNNRLATALHAGLAVVADAIPSYEPFRSACRLDDWEAGLRAYLADPEARERDVRAGRAQVRNEWLLPRIADRWQHLFAAIGGRGREYGGLS